LQEDSGKYVVISNIFISMACGACFAFSPALIAGIFIYLTWLGISVMNAIGVLRLLETI
jgi:hypothetical protein